MSDNETREQAPTPSEPQEVQRSWTTMLANDAHSVIVDGVKIAMGIGIAKALDRRNPPDAKPPKEGEGG
jgi:hypothetical protein